MGDYLGLDLIIRATLVLALPLAIALFWQRSSAAQRHLVWILSLAAVILLPVFRLALPAWRLAVLPANARPISDSETVSLQPASWNEARDAGRVMRIPRESDASDLAAEPAPTPRVFGWESLPYFWGIGVAVSLVALVLRHLRLARCASRWRDLGEPHIIALAGELAARLKIGRPVRILQADRNTMPMVWCWRRPVIALPTGASDWPPQRLRAVLFHELAHVRRWDCLTRMIGQGAVALYWFHPLAWLALKRLTREQEQACDDVVLDSGLRPSDYSSALLAVAHEYRSALAWASALPVARASHLQARVQSILAPGRRRKPVTFKSAAMLAIAALIACMSLAAIQPAVRAVTLDATSLDEKPALPRDQLEERTVNVTVRDAGGQAVPAADVYWLAPAERQLLPVVQPKDMQQTQTYGPTVCAKGVTDSHGRLTLRAPLNIAALTGDANPTNEPPTRLVAKAAGKALATLQLPLNQTSVEMKLPDEKLIEGKLLTPTGAPAADVRVHIDYLDLAAGGNLWDRTAGSSSPVYWPPPAVTDRDGRFTLHGMPAGGRAVLAIVSDKFARELITVSTLDQPTAVDKAFEVTSLPPRFTHALLPPRIFEGTITAKDSNKPLAEMLVELIAMGKHGGRPVYVHTDAEGHYRIASDQAYQGYGITIHPPSSSGYLASVWHLDPWPDASKTIFKKDFALAKGRLVEGRVVEHESGRPLASVSVMYQPGRDNKAKKRSYDLRDPVLTDRDGKFLLTVLPGPGFLVAEGLGPFARIKLPRSESGSYMDVFPQGYTRIDVPDKEPVPPAEITFKRGITLESLALEPDGKAVPWILACCREQDSHHMHRWDKGWRYENGLFRLRNCEPDRSYHVLLLQPDLKLGAVADLIADPQRKKAIEVKLQPTGSIFGRVVHADGSPAKKIQAGLCVRLDVETGTIAIPRLGDEEDQWAFYANFLGHEAFGSLRDEQQTNDNGEFHLTCLVPGASMYLTAATEDLYAAVEPVPPLKPNESRNLGTLVLKKRGSGK